MTFRSQPLFHPQQSPPLSFRLRRHLARMVVIFYFPYLPDFSPITTSKPGLDATRSHFQPYLSSIFDHFHRFHDIRNHSTRQTLDDVDDISGGQGQALVACLRQVPALYFKQDFELQDGTTFKAACPFSTFTENSELQERLSQYLDVVEVHLVKEISLRSNSFFEAQQQLSDLNVKIAEGCKRIRDLKETIRVLDGEIVGSARQIQEFSIMRSNLLVLQRKMRLILYINQALSALKLDGDELAGLHCFRHLRDHVATSMDAINSILSAEFMRASLHDAGDLDVVILSKANERATTTRNGGLDDVKLDEEETSNIRDRLLPIITGLLRTLSYFSLLSYTLRLLLVIHCFNSSAV